MTIKINRSHAMPFGTELFDDGRVRFRLWAPTAEKVNICLGSGKAEAVLPMAAQQEGWFGIITEMATVGTHYRFEIDGKLRVPDPASRFQPQDVHGPSEVIDPCAWKWQDSHWHGRPWEEAVIYELHVGTFTPQGTFAAIHEKLDHLVNLGVTAIELMPVADFPGARNWGYDGVLLYAPDSRYGRPEDLKALIDAAHARSLMVFMDVVYNHFGPDGNYLHAYAEQFFTQRHKTPWGAAINYDDADSRWVRQFVIHNALYWLEEYHLDGLRLDAVHAIIDGSEPGILIELAERVRTLFGDRRHAHLILENDHNAGRYLARDEKQRPMWYAAQWNDDLHHALHVLLTEEKTAYYADYGDDPIQHLGNCLVHGFAYQGQRSIHRNGQPRGEPSSNLPLTAFVSFLQNHDQIGNRAFGERISRLTSPEALRAALTLLLLAPSPPLLFMGQEWNSNQPFLFFCDFDPELGSKVVAGRREEFAHFPEFSDPAARERIPDPTDPQTFLRSVLDWNEATSTEHNYWLKLHRQLLSLRHRRLVPRLYSMRPEKNFTKLTERALSARWTLGDSAELFVLANLGHDTLTGINPPQTHILYTTHPEELKQPGIDHLPPWSVAWYLHT